MNDEKKSKKSETIKKELGARLFGTLRHGESHFLQFFPVNQTNVFDK